ncbi:rhomboid family intramembrane serine protease [Trichlorobacter ammonificans]|uniref:Rhomboid family protein n=1 Tax=Trichlorobacter ammonificans TaxID=2916410 RepID=A0ABM9DAT0_9BACT|nr:rhomboid family intramembrane serine protease [Trichlorobacter ammonificans]CAH2031463.1 Rhomboid family protein [Trichlorobacter ammonificans]
MSREAPDIPEEGPWRLLEPEEVIADGTGQVRRIWSLVLASRDIPYRLIRREGMLVVLVPEERLADALHELRRFEEENRHWPPAPPVSRPPGGTVYSTLSVLLLLAAFHNLVRADYLIIQGRYPDWLQLGMAQADLIRDGEWWRLVTALTLHADLQHLLGNLVIGGLFVLLLCRETGSGLGWSLILAAGTLGNLANAWLQNADHRSVGGSTAVFGAVGILAAISAIRYRHHLRRRRLLPVAAALALLVLLGSEGEHTDLGAHLFGLLAGFLLGLPAGLLLIRHRRPGPVLHLLLALGSALLVAAAWWLALALPY